MQVPEVGRAQGLRLPERRQLVRRTYLTTVKYKRMYIHPEAWDMFGDSSLSAVQQEKEEIPAELSADTTEHIVYNIVY